MGFDIQFNSKTREHARAYFPSLCCRARSTAFELMCPVRALIQGASQDLIQKSFLKAVNRGRKFTEYFQRISGLEETFAPYALRIGGRTWMLNQGMDRQFCDFLGVWKSPDASARYYRGNPHAVINRLKRFYFSLPKTPAG